MAALFNYPVLAIFSVYYLLHAGFGMVLSREQRKDPENPEDSEKFLLLEQPPS